ncbi:predicted protein [Naegleria gruberi]|uniref:Predicted protein n=1 Tax=Naegleria gruberi TaxID=5762 RepID=D2VZI5_NAEGR|nr:uncharacterized protein NAEGRDRAFT_74500 [Naegleria gruberi]EFC37853.1 predicted protein [Naegleria gruberi]|eukprot:XP_002670597.1 predicted protein [Naegleria gruberi strain NEG-M]
MQQASNEHEVINLMDDDEDDVSTDAGNALTEGEDVTLEVTSRQPPSAAIIQNTNFNNNNFYGEDDKTEDAEDVEERNQLFRQMNRFVTSSSNNTPVLFIGFSGVGASDDDELVNTTLKFYQRADTSFPSFKHALARKVNFVIPYVKQSLELEEEHSLLTAEVIPLISSEMDNQKASCRQWDMPLVRKVDQSISTYSNIEATKLFSLNLGLEKVLGTKINDNEFEEEFSKIFFSVYGDDARQIFDIVGDIIDLDPPEDN